MTIWQRIMSFLLHMYCDFWYTFVKWWYIQQIFSFFKILVLGFFRGAKGQKITLSCQFQYVLLYISENADHIIKNLKMISTGVLLYFFFFLKKFILVNIKIILFLLAYFNNVFNHYLFFKFINKCQKEILRCAPPSSHLCDFFRVVFIVCIGVSTLTQ